MYQPLQKNIRDMRYDKEQFGLIHQKVNIRQTMYCLVAFQECVRCLVSYPGSFVAGYF